MGRIGACADNAAMESFFSLLQKNILDRQRWQNRQELRLAITTLIERTYHRPRRQGFVAATRWTSTIRRLSTRQSHPEPRKECHRFSGAFCGPHVGWVGDIYGCGGFSREKVQPAGFSAARQAATARAALKVHVAVPVDPAAA